MLDLAHEPLPNSRLGCCIELRYASMLKVTSWQRPSSAPEARLAALGGLALPGRGLATGIPATASGA